MLGEFMTKREIMAVCVHLFKYLYVIILYYLYCLLWHVETTSVTSVLNLRSNRWQLDAECWVHVLQLVWVLWSPAAWPWWRPVEPPFAEASRGRGMFCLLLDPFGAAIASPVSGRICLAHRITGSIAGLTRKRDNSQTSKGRKMARRCGLITKKLLHGLRSGWMRKATYGNLLLPRMTYGKTWLTLHMNGKTFEQRSVAPDFLTSGTKKMRCRSG